MASSHESLVNLTGKPINVGQDPTNKKKKYDEDKKKKETDPGWADKA